MGDLIRTVGDGMGSLVGGSIAALAAAFQAVVGQLQVWLPGPLLPVLAIVVALLFVRWLFRK